MRDRYLCVDCFAKKKIKKADLVHHIREYKDEPTLGLTLSNLRSVCNACHNSIHKSSFEKPHKSAERVSNKINVVVSKSNPEIF